MEIRPCQPDDYPVIAGIYNYYIEQTVISFEEAPLTVAEVERRVLDTTRDFPWLVCADRGQVVGYAYASKWQGRCAYRLTTETTIYLRQGSGGRGYGTAIYAELLARLREQGLHTAIAGIALPNEASVALHERLGFHKVAHFSEVGYKQGRWIDVGYWQKPLSD